MAEEREEAKRSVDTTNTGLSVVGAVAEQLSNLHSGLGQAARQSAQQISKAAARLGAVGAVLSAALDKDRMRGTAVAIGGIVGTAVGGCWVPLRQVLEPLRVAWLWDMLSHHSPGLRMTAYSGKVPEIHMVKIPLHQDLVWVTITPPPMGLTAARPPRGALAVAQAAMA